MPDLQKRFLQRGRDRMILMMIVDYENIGLLMMTAAAMMMMAQKL